MIDRRPKSGQDSRVSKKLYDQVIKIPVTADFYDWFKKTCKVRGTPMAEIARQLFSQLRKRSEK